MLYAIPTCTSATLLILLLLLHMPQAYCYLFSHHHQPPPPSLDHHIDHPIAIIIPLTSPQIKLKLNNKYCLSNSLALAVVCVCLYPTIINQPHPPLHSYIIIEREVYNFSLIQYGFVVVFPFVRLFVHAA